MSLTNTLHTDLSHYGSYLASMLPKYIQRVTLYKDELSLHVSPSGLIPVMTFLRDHSKCLFRSLMDISGVDYPKREYRFEMNYHLLSVEYNRRIRVKTFASETSGIPSMTCLFPSANFHERENWDMFGVLFEGHPDLRRILTDYGFQGHPFRKDFPLTGYTEVRYDEEKKRVVIEPLEMTQEYRRFHLSNAWEQVPNRN
jgi:NADH dehydrogenase (ubiquinone) Fe-S protein 3